MFPASGKGSGSEELEEGYNWDDQVMKSGLLNMVGLDAGLEIPVMELYDSSEKNPEFVQSYMKRVNQA
jgi:hypothetical protein